MTAPKIGERHRECADLAINAYFEWMDARDPALDRHEDDGDLGRNHVAEIIAKHFPEDGYVRIPAERYKQMTDDSWVERAAEEICKTFDIEDWCDGRRGE